MYAFSLPLRRERSVIWQSSTALINREVTRRHEAQRNAGRVHWQVVGL